MQMPEANAVEKTEKTARKEKIAKKRLDGLRRYFAETRAEVKKVVWPTRKQVVNNTVVVIVAIIVVGIFIWGVDSLSTFVLSKIFHI